MAIGGYKAALVGAPKVASEAVADIIQRITDCGKRGGAPYQLKFANAVLKDICQAIRSNGVNYTIYCDVIENILAPNLDPTACAITWSHFLELARYFYSLLYDKRLCMEMKRTYQWLVQQPGKVQQTKDIEYVLGVYMQHLLGQMAPSDRLSGNIEVIVADIATFFHEIQQRKSQLNVSYQMMLTTFTKFLIPKKTPAIYKYIANLPNKTSMFNGFFELLHSLEVSKMQSEQANALFIEHMQIFITFMKIDMSSSSITEQESLNLLRCCRDSQIFSNFKTLSYSLSLLSHFVKFIFYEGKADNFEVMCVELLTKMKTYLSTSDDVLMQKNWYMELIAVISMLMFQLEENSTSAFSVFKEQIRNSATVFALYMELQLDIIQRCLRITDMKLNVWSCCNNTGKHTMLLVSMAAMRSYIAYISNVHNSKTTSKDSSINAYFSKIVCKSVEVISSLDCIDHSSATIASFHSRFDMVLSKVNTESQVLLCVSLAEEIAKMRHKFSKQMWINILRRLRSAVAIVSDTKIVSEMHAIHIGCLLKSKHFNYSELIHNIGIYYTKENFVHDSCLLQTLARTKSPLKPPLNAREQQLLYTAESQIVFKYNKTNSSLHASLLNSSPSPIDYVLVARLAKEMDTRSKVLHIYKSLADRSSNLKRLDLLTMGHTCTHLASKQVEEMKKIFSCDSKNYTEDDLDEVLLTEEIRNIDIFHETQLIDLMSKGLDCFEDFFKKADDEFLSSDEILVDWEAIMDDISVLARLLQYRGYMDRACKGWLLLYRIATFLNDSMNTIRALAFMCQHVTHIDSISSIVMGEEIDRNLNSLLYHMECIEQLTPRRQNYVLVCLCQLAYYYACNGHYTYAETLLALVELKRDILSNRKDKFDFVLGTLVAVKFRILWKCNDVHLSNFMANEYLTVHMCNILHYFRKFVYITSEDSLNYMILLFDLIQEITECCANRLIDNVACGFLKSILKVALETGSALRVTQILTVWALANLQMEYVDKAQKKLQIAEYFLRIRELEEFTKEKVILQPQYLHQKHNHEIITQTMKSWDESFDINTGVESIRRAPQIAHYTIVKEAKEMELLRYFNYSAYNDVIARMDVLQWSCLSVAFIRARFFYLIKEYAQLESFYDDSYQWCSRQRGTFFWTYFLHVQIVSLKFYVNFLRSQKKYDKALLYAGKALSYHDEFSQLLDNTFKVNMELQKMAIESEMAMQTAGNNDVVEENAESEEDMLQYSGMRDHQGRWSCTKDGENLLQTLEGDKSDSDSMEKQQQTTTPSSPRQPLNSPSTRRQNQMPAEEGSDQRSERWNDNRASDEVIVIDSGDAIDASPMVWKKRVEQQTVSSVVITPLKLSRTRQCTKNNRVSSACAATDDIVEKITSLKLTSNIPITTCSPSPAQRITRWRQRTRAVTSTQNNAMTIERSDRCQSKKNSRGNALSSVASSSTSIDIELKEKGAGAGARRNRPQRTTTPRKPKTEKETEHQAAEAKITITRRRRQLM